MWSTVNEHCRSHQNILHRRGINNHNKITFRLREKRERDDFSFTISFFSFTYSSRTLILHLRDMYVLKSTVMILIHENKKQKHTDSALEFNFPINFNVNISFQKNNLLLVCFVFKTKIFSQSFFHSQDNRFRWKEKLLLTIVTSARYNFEFIAHFIRTLCVHPSNLSVLPTNKSLNINIFLSNNYLKR